MELILIRHLKTPGNEKRQYIGSTDEELSEQEVLNFKQKYKIDSYPQVEQVIVSPMKWCIQTAELIYPKNQITQEELLKECDFGIFEGKTYEELKELNVRLQKMNEETPAMREKQKADPLMENEMYVHAIQVYQNLLEREDLEEIREGMTEKVYHNLGCAYSYLFQMEKATEYFRKAYEGSRSREALEAYLIAFGMTRTSSEYEKMAKSLGTEKEVLQNIRERLQEFSKTPELVVNKTNMDEILTRLTREYHRSTGS